MAGQGYSDELQRALARSDAAELIRQMDDYADYFARGAGDWPDHLADDFEAIVGCHHDDPDKALAYVVIGAWRSDDARFLGYLGCGPLEDLLRAPSAELLERIVAEARKSACFRWLLSNPFKSAMSASSWDVIKTFRVTGPHEEPPEDTLPPRHVN